MSLKLEIEGVMLNVVSGYAPQVGCELEEKERFWSELDEVMESIPTVLISLIPVAQAQGSPQAVVSITPDTRVFIGESVTLRCDIQGGGDTQWTYSWKINNNGLTESRGRVYRDSTRQEFRIRSVNDSDSGTYTCRGHKSDSQSSEISDAVTLTVSAKPKATVRVNPQSSVYTGDTVTLSCELQQGTGWEFHWYKNNQWLQKSEQENTLKVTEDNAGETEYKCRARRRNDYTHYSYYYNGYYDTEFSDPVKITVRVASLRLYVGQCGVAVSVMFMSRVSC
ncbi:hypothetical protein QTP86_002337 [Hemibagrus guttatus]|nr:hypothetical protein QTP86_002337 [Hemibagrus guttatus]